MSGLARRRALIRKLRPYPDEARRLVCLRARRQNLTPQEAQELAMLEERIRPWKNARLDEALRWFRRQDRRGLCGTLTAKQVEELEKEYEVRHAPSRIGALHAHCWNRILRGDLTFMLSQGEAEFAHWRLRESRKKRY